MLDCKSTKGKKKIGPKKKNVFNDFCIIFLLDYYRSYIWILNCLKYYKIHLKINVKCSIPKSPTYIITITIVWRGSFYQENSTLFKKFYSIKSRSAIQSLVQFLHELLTIWAKFSIIL